MDWPNRIPLDESLRVQWEFATGFNVHDRNMIWGNYSYHALMGEKAEMDNEETIMRVLLAKLAQGPINLRQEYRALRLLKGA